MFHGSGKLIGQNPGHNIGGGSSIRDLEKDQQINCRRQAQTDGNGHTDQQQDPQNNKNTVASIPIPL